MFRRTIRINPASMLIFFTIGLLSAFYFPLLPVLVLSTVAALFLLINRNPFPLPPAAGILAGSILQLMILSNLASSGTGLPPEEIIGARIELTDDSFLSRTGSRILRGRLLSVRNSRGVECSASGDILLIGGRDREPLFLGQIVQSSLQLSSYSDSREFSFIGFTRGKVVIEGWAGKIYSLRQQVIVLFERKASFLPPETASLFSALYRGNTDLLDGEFRRQFSTSGIPHLLALSGFHVAIVVLLLTGILKRLIGTKYAYLVALPFLHLYLFFVGPSPSLVRAVYMFTIAAFFRLADRDISIFQLLLLTGILQMFLFPSQALSLSFQLSYVALGGILVFSGRFHSRFERHLPSFLSLPLGASLAAHIATAPILLFSMGELYPAGIGASLLVTPLIVLFMWFSMAVFLLSLAGFPLRIIEGGGFICEKLIAFIGSVTSRFSALPSPDFSRRTNAALYLLLLLLVVIWLYGRGKGTEFKLRFSRGNPGAARAYGAGAEKKMEPEFSD